MHEKIGSLALILEKMNDIYHRVLDLMDRERASLIKLDYEQLFIEMNEKDELLAILRGLDRDRLKIQDQFALVMDKKSSEVTVKSLAEMLLSQDPNSAKDGQRLLVLREKLNETVEQLRQKIGGNKVFIEHSIDNLHGIAEQLASAYTGGKRTKNRAKKSNVYTGKGKIEEPSKVAGSLVEKRF